MDIENAASLLKELGHTTRLSIYRRLVKAGTEGLPVGEIQKELEIPASTLSHHISALVTVGLIKQRREGRTLYCTTQYETLQNLLSFMTDQCCSDQPSNTITTTPTQSADVNYWKQHSQW